MIAERVLAQLPSLLAPLDKLERLLFPEKRIRKQAASNAGIWFPEYCRRIEGGEKLCSECRRWLPRDDEHFPRNRRNYDGLTNYCRPCSVERSLAWARANPERAKEQHRRFAKSPAAKRLRVKHADAIRAGMRRWREQNTARIRDYMRDYRSARVEHLAALATSWRRRNPDTVRAQKRQYRERHPDRVRDNNIRRMLRRRGQAIGPIDYDAVLLRDSGRCGICGLPVNPAELHYDHIVPLARGGAHAVDNIQVAHAACNLRKGSR